MTQRVRPRVGVSSCLLGESVRYDGGHKHSPALTALADRVEWIAVCPEVEVGMGVPREPVHLAVPATIVGSGDGSGAAGIRLLGVSSGVDWTPLMSAYAAGKVADLARQEICGYVVKARSPSCGLDVAHHGAAPAAAPDRRADVPISGPGLFVRALRMHLPDLPLVEDEALGTPDACAHFLERINGYQRLRALFADGWRTAALVRFHARHKMQLLAHSRRLYTELGRTVAAAGPADRVQMSSDYQRLFMQTLAEPTTRGRHADVLTHLAGHLKDRVSADLRQQLTQSIGDFQAGTVDRLVPLRLLRDYAVAAGAVYVTEQTYLDAVDDHAS